MTLVRIPEWAILNGLPEPEHEETFDDYWARVGMDTKVIDWALLDIDDNPRKREVANERMHSYLIRRHPEVFRKFVNSLGTRPRRTLHLSDD